MTHSDTYNHIHGEHSDLEDGEVHWRFRRILAQVEWETGEQTMEPLNLVTADDPVTVARHAKEHNMLETDGRKRRKRTAERDKVLNRLVNQAKLRSF